jgi:hypothetical protein
VNERYKKFIVGTLFKFVHAPPREGYKEEPREPDELLGKVGSVVSGPHEDNHDWGGIFEVLVSGQVFRYHGDFMEAI